MQLVFMRLEFKKFETVVDVALRQVEELLSACEPQQLAQQQKGPRHENPRISLICFGLVETHTPSDEI